MLCLMCQRHDADTADTASNAENSMGDGADWCIYTYNPMHYTKGALMHGLLWNDRYWNLSHIECQESKTDRGTGTHSAGFLKLSSVGVGGLAWTVEGG